MERGQLTDGVYPSASIKGRRGAGVDKSARALLEPRRVCDREHVQRVAQQPCLVCGRIPCDAHHLRFTRAARSVVRSVTSSPFHSAAAIISKCIATAMNLPGEKSSGLIRHLLPARSGWTAIRCRSVRQGRTTRAPNLHGEGARAKKVALRAPRTGRFPKQSRSRGLVSHDPLKQIAANAMALPAQRRAPWTDRRDSDRCIGGCRRVTACRSCGNLHGSAITMRFTDRDSPLHRSFPGLSFSIAIEAYYGTSTGPQP
jgi:hypothetical protein